ncbi:MAG TPA: CPBP family intramembrane glutamic endopeptidase [Ktedonosporobacter sp.]|nr:CPBP family intramembrane glutamic endopeptidase [Ktedonosporobacter sp.]
MDSHTARFAFVRKHPVMTFFVITFLIGYIAAIPLFFTRISALGLIAASSSSLGGIVTAALYGKKEVKRLFASLVQFRCGGLSYLCALLLPPTLVVGAILVNMLFGHPFPAFDVENWKLILPMFVLSLIQAGLGEEMGWRGFALPHLVKKTRPLTAALIIGGVWACWHLPLYFFPGFIQHDVAQTSGFVVAFVIYSTFVVAASVIFSWLYLRSRNSLIPAILIHGMLNVCGWYFHYQDTHAYGGLTMLIALSLFWVVAAVLVSVTSPIFRTQGAALFRRRLPQPSVREAAEQAQI